MSQNDTLKRLAIFVFVLSLCFSQATSAGLLQKLGNIIATGVTTVAANIVNTAASAFNSILNVVTSCSDSNIHGISAKCFNSAEKSKLNSAMNILANTQHNVSHNTLINPYTYFKAHTKRLVNWDSRQMRLTYISGHASGCGNNWGCHSFDGTTFLTGAGLSLDAVTMSGLLIHESDHNRKLHNCGHAADKDTNGPYGLEAFYHMSQVRAKHSSLTLGQKSLAQARAIAIANNQMCNNTVARDKILNYK